MKNQLTLNLFSESKAGDTLRGYADSWPLPEATRRQMLEAAARLDEEQATVEIEKLGEGIYTATISNSVRILATKTLQGQLATRQWVKWISKKNGWPCKLPAPILSDKFWTASKKVKELAH